MSTERPRARWPVGLLILVAVLPGCGSSPTQTNTVTVVPSPPYSSPSPLTSATGVAWKVLTDGKYGYRFEYPPTWNEVITSPPMTPGSHALASRLDLKDVRQLGISDVWFTAVEEPECGNPVDARRQEAVVVDGHPGLLYVRPRPVAGRGTLIEVIARNGGRCDQLDLTAGDSLSEFDAQDLVARVVATYRFGP